MFAINSELYPSPRNPCRHKSVWPRRRTEAEESSSLTRSAMAIEPLGIANCATASQPSQNDSQASLLGPCHRRLEMMMPMFAVKREEPIRSLNILSRTAPHSAIGQMSKVHYIKIS